VIGAGGRGRLAANAHRPGKGACLVAAADVYPKPLAEFAATYSGAQTFDDYRRMLDTVELDAVFVCSPDYLHEEHAVAVLNRGIAVYLEKPMAISVESCDRILASAKASGARLYVGHNMRHMSFVRELKRIIDSGAIGQVKAAWCRHFISYGGDAYFKDWHSERRYVNSLLLQKAVHDVDVLHWLCGGYTQEVVAMGDLTVYDENPNRRDPSQHVPAPWSQDHWPPLSVKGLSPIIDVEDINHVLMRLDNGVQATYQQCHYSPDAWRNYVVIGTEGRIENFGDSPGECEIRVWNKRTGYKERGDLQFPIPAVEGGHGGADPLIVDEFLRYVRDGVETTTDPIAARNAVVAMVLAAESVRSGSMPRQIPPVNLQVRPIDYKATIAQR
jgi:predicted dehydrogenase